MIGSPSPRVEPESSQPCLKETVQTFFQAVAWDGQVITAASALESTTAESIMTMTVSDFFDAVPWDGQPSIGAPVEPLEPSPPHLDTDFNLTLDGLSDLFG
ncbi:MAG: hypothetical protein WBB18_11070 [Nodosilinea sp.]